MKVALISPLPPPEGGIATWTKGAEDYFNNNKIQYRIINNAVIGKRKEKINSKTSIQDEVIRTINIIKKLNETLSSFNPDILHINTSCGKFGIVRDYICMLIAQKKYIPCVLHCHCNVKDQLHSSFSEFIFKRMTHLSAKTLVLNSATQSYVKEKTKVDSILIPNFIDIKLESIIEKTTKVDIKDILFVGHVQITKGCKEIVEVAKKCPQYRFTLVGPVEDKFSKITYPKNVKLVGKKEHREISKYMREADVFLFPSYTEGFSNALLEAMESGLPIVASDVGANRDMIEDKGGIVVEPQNVDMIVKALSFLENSDIRRKMSKWNIEKVSQCYSKKEVMGKIVEIYRCILK